MTAPTITVDSISSTNAFVQITFSEEVTNAVGNDLSRYDFSLSISGGNSSYLTLDSIPASIANFAPTFPRTYKLFLDFTSGDGNFHPNGNETLTIAPASSTSIKNSSNEYWTASATTSLTAQTTVKTVITNNEDQHLWFYLYAGNPTYLAADVKGTNNSYWRYLGSASAGSHVTSSAMGVAIFNDVGPHGVYGESIISSTQALELDQYVTTMSNLISKSGSVVQTYADNSNKLLVSDGIWESSETDHSSKHPIMHSDTRYLKITRPSGSAETTWGTSIHTAAQWGTWSTFALNGTTEFDMDPPTLISFTSSARNSLSLTFSEPIVQSNGDAHTTSSIPMNSSGLRLSSPANIGVNEFTLQSVSYHGESVPDDTITFEFQYDGEVTGSEPLSFDLSQYIARDANGIYPQSNITGQTGFGTTGKTRTDQTITLNIANSGSSTKHFYMKVDYGVPNSFKDHSGNPGNSWLSLGSAVQDQTLTTTVSDFYLNGIVYDTSNYISEYNIYAYDSAQDASNFSSEAPNQYSTPSVTIHQVSSSSEPRWGAGRVRYDIPFDGSNFGTVVPYDSGGNALDIQASLPNITSTNSGGNLYVVADFGERMRLPGYEESYGSFNFTSSINSTDDLSNVLTGSLFSIYRDSFYTGSIGETISISEANYVTSPSNSAVSGAWAITASYTGNADGTERLQFGWNGSIYGVSVYDDSLNSKDVDAVLRADLFYSANERASWPTTDQYGNYGRLGPLSQDSLAATVTETVAAASGGTIQAGGTNAAPRAEVTIPANALSTDTEISVDTSADETTATLGLAEFGQEAVSPLVSLTPHGTTFSSGVTVKFNLTGTAEGTCPAGLTLMKRNGTGGPWYPVPSHLYSCSDGVITLTTTTFSEYIIIGGQKVARTRLNNVQLARLEIADKVLPEAINITGSSATTPTEVQAADLFIIHTNAGDSAPVSASVMANYFASAVAATKIDVKERDTAADHRITFISDLSGDADDSILYADDNGLLFNPSTNLLTVHGSVSGSSLIVGNANLSQADLEKLDDIVDGTAAANKALVLNSDADITAGLRNMTLSGDIDVDGTANLDAVDIDGNVQADGTITVGASEDGYDVKFFGNGAGKSLLWDEDEDSLIITGDAVDALKVVGGVDIDGAVQIDAGDLNVGVDGTGRDVKFFGDTVSAYMQWDASEDDLILGGAARVVIPDGQLVLNATAVDATAAEINVLDDASSNSQAGKALVFDSNGDFEMQDEDKIFFGNDEDSSISWDGSKLLVDSAAVTIGANGSTVTMPGNLVVQGTTVTVDATTVTVEDPVMTLGDSQGDIDADDDKDRGIEFKYHDGSSAKAGFFGYDDSTGYLTYIPDATNNLEVFSGDQGTASFGATRVPNSGLIIGGTIVSSTAAELNKLDGAGPDVTAAKLTTLSALTNDEIGFLDGAQAGQAGASKAVVLSSTLDFEGFRDLSGSRHISASQFYGDGSKLTNVGAAVATSTDNTEFKLTFVEDTATSKADLLIDSTAHAVYNPSTNALGVAVVSGSSVLAVEAHNGAVTISGSQGVTLSSIVSVAKQATFSEAITGSAGLQLAGPADLNGALDVAGEAKFAESITGSAGIQLAGNADLNAALDVQGAANLQSTLDVAGDTSVSTLDSSGATQLATAGGAVTIADGGGTVAIGSTGVMTTVKGTLNVDEAVTLDSTLDVTGDTTVSTFDSSGATSLATGGGVVNIASSGLMTTIKGTLNVDEAVTLDTTLDVTGKTTLDGAVELGNAAADLIAISGTLTVIPTADFDGGLTIAAGQDIAAAGQMDITAGDTGKLNLSGAANVQFDSLADFEHGVTIADGKDIAGDGQLDITAGGTGALHISGAGGLKIDSVRDLTLSTTNTDHYLLVQDASDGDMVKRELASDYMSTIAGDGLFVDSGKITVDSVEKIFFSQSLIGSVNDGAAGKMTTNLMTASLDTSADGDVLPDSLQVFLNGMLQTVSSSAGHTSHLDVFDYRLDDYTTPTKIEMIHPLDGDDILVVRYIRK